MERDYSIILGLTKTLRETNGYLTPEEKLVIGRTEETFNEERNRIAFETLKSAPDVATAKIIVSRELEEWARRLRQSGADFDWESDIAMVQSSLHQRIDGEGQKSRFRQKLGSIGIRRLISWGFVAFVVVLWLIAALTG